jgi:protein ImuB
MFACIHLPGAPDATKHLRDCAGNFTPEAELTAPNTILFDVSRLNRLYGSLQDIADSIARSTRTFSLHANIAIAPNTETALLAARNFSGISIIPEDAADALARIDIDHLPLTPELWQTLESWGIRTFRDFAALPQTGIAERLGAEGVYLHRLAQGEVNRPLRALQPDISFEERVVLEHALSELEPLLFIVGRILNNQCENLQMHGLAANELHLTLGLENRTAHVRQIRLPLPMRQSKAMLKLLQLDLEAHRPEARVLTVHLLLKPGQPRTIQNGMFVPVTPAPDKLEITLTRIRALVGEQNVGVPELMNTHRPASFRLVNKHPSVVQQLSQQEMKPQLAFRYFNPPLQARVELQGDTPVRLAAGAIRGNVITCAGPWRSSGDWWTENPWKRDEWDVSLNDGAIYRIYREPDQSWFVEGAYD